MTVVVGRIQGLYRYPVKSMAGERLESGLLGWHGLAGDRRCAFLREDYKGGFPWLSAGRLPALVLYRPHAEGGAEEATHVTTPRGAILELEGEPLRGELSTAFGSPVRLMRLDHGMFDEAPVSVITTATIRTIEAAAGRSLDVRRFRPNILLDVASDAPFPEDAWIGGRLCFGDGADAPAMSVTQRDVRCTMMGLDPDTAASDPGVLKATVRIHETCAGVYGTTLRAGPIAVGDRVYLVSDAPS
jgi:uncharacterized protein YcbX